LLTRIFACGLMLAAIAGPHPVAAQVTPQSVPPSIKPAPEKSATAPSGAPAKAVKPTAKKPAPDDKGGDKGNGKTAPSKPDATPAKTKTATDPPGKAAAPAQTEPDVVMAPGDEPDEGSGLPVPRFVSLRAETVNLRSGPGLRYPMEWVYRRKRLPVEVVAEFETWRRIRDPDGTEGWVHQTMITGRRTGIVRGTQPLQRSDGDESHPLAILSPGVVVNVQRCPANSPFCRVEVNGLQGWLRRERFWGVYPNEVVE
jgi:SH3-like domain-containing protein